MPRSQLSPNACAAVLLEMDVFPVKLLLFRLFQGCVSRRTRGCRLLNSVPGGIIPSPMGNVFPRCATACPVHAAPALLRVSRAWPFPGDLRCRPSCASRCFPCREKSRLIRVLVTRAALLFRGHTRARWRFPRASCCGTLSCGFVFPSLDTPQSLSFPSGFIIRFCAATPPYSAAATKCIYFLSFRGQGPGHSLAFPLRVSHARRPETCCLARGLGS